MTRSPSSPAGPTRPRRDAAAFSLVEILVVAGLFGAFSFAFIGGLKPGRTVALQSAQSIVANLLVAARLRAVADGSTTRLLVNQGSSGSGPAVPARLLRCLVLEEQAVDGGAWQMVAESFLPAGVCVVPELSRTPSGLLAAPTAWTTVTGGALHSSALSTLAEPAAVSSYPDDTWSVVTFSREGTPDPPGGCVVLALARSVPPGHELPVQLPDPQSVRGIRLSRYGVPVLLDGRSDF